MSSAIELKLEKKSFSPKVIEFQRTKKGYPVIHTGSFLKDKITKYIYLYDLKKNEKSFLEKTKYRLSFLGVNDLIIKIYSDSVGIGYSVFYVLDIFNMNNKGKAVLLVRKSPQDANLIYVNDLKSLKSSDQYKSINYINNDINTFLIEFFKEKCDELFKIKFNIHY